MDQPLFQKITILGPGLLGGSLALAIRHRKLATRLSLYARSEKARQEIISSGLDAEITGDPVHAVHGAGLVILCVPVGCMRDLMEQVLPGLDPHAIVTDVGSVKAPVVNALEPLLAGKARWIGSHPMAGSEQSGFSAARENLFENAVTILTPNSPHTSSSSETFKQIEQFWKAVGCRTFQTTPENHDKLVAEISHLPHLVAAALVKNASGESLPLIGNGFRDTTRIASGSPDLWTEILLSNRDAVTATLTRLIDILNTSREQLQAGNEKGLQELLTHANHIRSQIPPKPSS